MVPAQSCKVVLCQLHRMSCRLLPSFYGLLRMRAACSGNSGGTDSRVKHPAPCHHASTRSCALCRGYMSPSICVLSDLQSDDHFLSGMFPVGPLFGRLEGRATMDPTSNSSTMSCTVCRFRVTVMKWLFLKGVDFCTSYTAER